jgi:hypothetical protein
MKIHVEQQEFFFWDLPVCLKPYKDLILIETSSSDDEAIHMKIPIYYKLFTDICCENSRCHYNDCALASRAIRILLVYFCKALHVMETNISGRGEGFCYAEMILLFGTEIQVLCKWSVARSVSGKAVWNCCHNN